MPHLTVNVNRVRDIYFEELYNNPLLKASPVYVLSSYSSYFTDLMWSELFAKRHGGKILRLVARSTHSTVVTDYSETETTTSPEAWAQFWLRKVSSNYRSEDHGPSELHDRFVAMKEMRGGDRDIATGLIYYFNPRTPIKYWLWMSVPQRKQHGQLSVWGNVASHFMNPWTPTRIPEQEPLWLECRLTRNKTDEYTGLERKWRTPITLDLVACDEIDFMAEDYMVFQDAIVKAHNSSSEELIKRNITPIIRETEAETKLLFWRNEYYPPLPEMPRIYNVRHYLNSLEMLR